MNDVYIEENVTFGGQTEYYVWVNGELAHETRNTGASWLSLAEAIAASYR